MYIYKQFYPLYEYKEPIFSIEFDNHWNYDCWEDKVQSTDLAMEKFFEFYYKKRFIKHCTVELEEKIFREFDIIIDATLCKNNHRILKSILFFEKDKEILLEFEDIDNDERYCYIPIPDNKDYKSYIPNVKQEDKVDCALDSWLPF